MSKENIQAVFKNFTQVKSKYPAKKCPQVKALLNVFKD